MHVLPMIHDTQWDISSVLALVVHDGLNMLNNKNTENTKEGKK